MIMTEKARTCAAWLLAALGTQIVATHAEARGFVHDQTKVKGLLVVELSSGDFAGTATQMNATATPVSDPKAETKITFNQKVGKEMELGLNEVIKHIRVRHKDKWPFGQKVEIAFAEKYSGKDGASASVACAVMLDAMLTGRELDQDFAVTGDLNADGAVQPVGAVPAKIKGAAKKKCRAVAIPYVNRDLLLDAIILDGPASLYDIQVFSIKTLDEALALSGAKKDAKIEESLKEFEQVQKVLQRPKGAAYLRNAKVQEKLKKVLRLTPNHLSARLLLAKGMGRLPRKLTLAGSIMQIDRTSGALMTAMENDSDKELGGLNRGEVSGALNAIRDSRGLIDKRVVPYTDALQDLGRLIRDYQASPPKAYPKHKQKIGEIRSAARRVNSAREKLLGDPEIANELIE